MRRRIVAMPLIPGGIQRGAVVRSGIGYARYAQATWQWWCRQRDIEFVTIERQLGGESYAAMPPTIQRWLAPEMLIGDLGPDAQVALVDADTMIRWDAPNFFDLAGPSLAAVRAGYPTWIFRSLKAYQHFFPEVFLPWWEYFNAGFVVLGKAQLPLLRSFLAFVTERWAELRAVQVSGEVGTDQTPLNLFVRRAGENVTALPPPFNTIHCFPLDPELRIAFEKTSVPDWSTFADKAFTPPNAFDFVDFGYVWHFTSVVAARELVMKEAWRRVSINYPGAEPHG